MKKICNFICAVYVALVVLAFTALSARANDFRGAEILTNPFHKVAVFGGSFVNHTIDAATDAVEFILLAPEAITYDRICFRYGARTGTPVAHKVGVEGVVATTQRADGTYATGSGECSASFTPPADATWNDTWQCRTVTGTTCALTRGQRFAITIKPTGVPDGSNNSTFTFRQSELTGAGESPRSEYPVTVNAGTGSVVTDYYPIIGWGTATRKFGYFFEAGNQTGYNSDSTPDEVAMRLNITGPAGCTYTIAGATVLAKAPNAGKTVKLIVYSGTTALDDATLDSDHQASHGSNGNLNFWIDDATLEPLSFNSTYYVGVQAQDTSMNMNIEDFEVEDNNHFDAWPLGAGVYMATRTNAGAWTDVTTKRPGINLRIGSITCSGGSGGRTGVTSVLGGGLQ